MSPDKSINLEKYRQVRTKSEAKNMLEAQKFRKYLATTKPKSSISGEKLDKNISSSINDIFQAFSEIDANIHMVASNEGK